MKRKLLPILLALIIFFSFCFSIPASAYQINDYEMHHEAGMVVHLETGTVVYEHNADQRMYPASVTKLMTALVMVENIPDLENTKIAYTSYANNLILGTGSVVLGLKVGEEMNAKDALAALLIPSCGDVAYAIAEHVGGSKEGFAEMMNAKAKELGLKDTHFVDPVGLHDDNHYTTARDVSIFAKAAFDVEVIKEITSKSRYTLGATNMRGERTIVTSNMLINPNSDAYYTYAESGKTGYTSKAGRCLVATASYKGYEYMSVVLKADTSGGVRRDFLDTANMFRWAFNSFEYKSVIEATTPVTEVPITLSSETDHLQVCFKDGLKALLPVEADSSTITYTVKLNQESYVAPVKKGTVLGTADIFYAEEKIGTVQLVAGQTVDATPLLVFGKLAGDFFTSTAMKIVYFSIAGIILLFILIIVFMNLGRKRRRHRSKVKYQPISQREIDKRIEREKEDDIDISSWR